MNNSIKEIIPARLNAEQTASYLGFHEHDIPVLVNKNLLKPLGKPLPNASKYFAKVVINEHYEDRQWLSKATQVIYDHWKTKNSRKSCSNRSIIEEASLAA